MIETCKIYFRSSRTKKCLKIFHSVAIVVPAIRNVVLKVNLKLCKFCFILPPLSLGAKNPIDMLHVIVTFRDFVHDNIRGQKDHSFTC